MPVLFTSSSTEQRSVYSGSSMTVGMFGVKLKHIQWARFGTETEAHAAWNSYVQWPEMHRLIIDTALDGARVSLKSLWSPSSRSGCLEGYAT